MTDCCMRHGVRFFVLVTRLDRQLRLQLFDYYFDYCEWHYYDYDASEFFVTSRKNDTVKTKKRKKRGRNRRTRRPSVTLTIAIPPRLGGPCVCAAVHVHAVCVWSKERPKVAGRGDFGFLLRVFEHHRQQCGPVCASSSLTDQPALQCRRPSPAAGCGGSAMFRRPLRPCHRRRRSPSQCTTPSR